MEWTNGSPILWEKKNISAKRIVKKLDIVETVNDDPLDFSLVEFFLDKNLKKLFKCLHLSYQNLLNACDLEVVISSDKSKTLILTILGESYQIFVDKEKNLVMQKKEAIIFKIIKNDDQVINAFNFDGNVYFQTSTLDERKYIKQVVYQETYEYGTEEQMESALYCVRPIHTTRNGYDFFEVSDLNEKKQQKHSFFENFKSNNILSVKRDYPKEMLDEIFRKLENCCKKEYEENKGIKR